MEIAVTGMEIRVDDLSGPEIAGLLKGHLDHMATLSPPDTVHTLDLESLRVPEVTFWTMWDGSNLLGCGALKELDSSFAEIKSMRTAPEHRGKGVAEQLVGHILDVARQRGYQRISLETGTHADFQPAHRLYKRFGFDYGDAFADYAVTEHNVCMTLELAPD
ncbi:MAG: GNAT family N-acetyltransferase [Anderseniella sp.]